MGSEPCLISSLGQQVSEPRNTKQDSASSVHGDGQVFSAPLDIQTAVAPGRQHAGPSAAPVNCRKNAKRATWQRRNKQQSPLKKSLVKNGGPDDAALGGKPKSCLKQGGLSQQLSKEPSVHQGIKRTITTTTTTTSAFANFSDETVAVSGDDSTDAMMMPVGSWGTRKVTFAQGRSDSAHTDDDGSHHHRHTESGGLLSDSTTSDELPSSSTEGVDPTELAAALNSLPMSPSAARSTTNNNNNNNTTNRRGASSTVSPGVIIGDSSLPADWIIETAAQQSANGEEGGISVVHLDVDEQSHSVASDPLPHSGGGGGSGRGGGEVYALTRSLDGGGAADNDDAFTSAAAGVRIAPRRSTSVSGSVEWNTRFVKRWRAVKHRARLQALGMRAIWKLNSPTAAGEHHHPPELLTNELPDGPPGLSPRSAASTLHPHPHASSSSFGFTIDPNSITSNTTRDQRDQQHHDHGMNRDPSLATMLLGEVAEVC